MLAGKKPFPRKQNEPSGRVKNRISFRRIGRSIPFLACLSEKEFREIEEVAIQKQFAKNEMILCEDETLDFFYFVSAGKIKVVKTSSEGKEHIIAVRGQGDFFGEMGMLDGKTAPAAVIAMEPCEVALISKSDFNRLLMNNEQVLREMIIMLAKRLREAWFDLSILRKTSAENRVRAYLDFLGKQFGVQDSRGILINLRMTHKELADCTCLSRETVSRNILKLVKSDEIMVLPGKFILLRPTFFINDDSIL